MIRDDLDKRLEDLSKNGKEINWARYKKHSLIISNSMYRTDLIKRANVIKYCGTHLTFGETMSGALKLVEADFCRDRLCPMCTWRRSLKLFGQTSKLMNYMKDNINVRYVFLTLTVKNCKGDELSSTIDALVKGFLKLMRRKEVKEKTLGACRQIEVTFNSNPMSDSYMTFHPHLHIIFAVAPSYYTSHHRMIQHKDWRSMWAECMDMDYQPQVNVQAVADHDQQQQEKAVAELSKYPIKMDTLLNIDPDQQELQDFAVYNMAVGLVSKRLIEYYGIFRKYRRDLKLEDIEKGDLVNSEISDDNDELTGVIRKYQWRIGLYIEVDNFDIVEF